MNTSNRRKYARRQDSTSMLYRYDVKLSPIGKFNRRSQMERRRVLVKGRFVNLIQPTYGDGPFHPNIKE